MSKLSRRRQPTLRPRNPAATRPPAGPESSMRTAWSPALSATTVSPELCITATRLPGRPACNLCR